jgi:phosphoserine aminotransferase
MTRTFEEINNDVLKVLERSKMNYVFNKLSREQIITFIQEAFKDGEKTKDKGVEVLGKLLYVSPYIIFYQNEMDRLFDLFLEFLEMKD